MRQQFRHQIILILVGLTIYMTNLGGAHLFDMDEALYATCAREMGQRANWVTPWFNGEMFPEKPPLMFWCMMVGTQLFGDNEFAVRIHSVFFALATSLSTYYIGRKLFRPEVGFWAGLITMTSIIFTVSARAATVDSALTFAITFAIAVLVSGGVSRAGEESAGRFVPRDYLPRSLWQFVLIYAAVGVAVLAKGPVGIIMVVGTMGLFLLMVPRANVAEGRELPPFITKHYRDMVGLIRLIAPWPVLRRLIIWMQPVSCFLLRFHPKRFFQAAWALRPITAIIVVALVAVPWYWMVWSRTDGQWIYQFLAKFNMGPASKAIQGHHGPFFYHLISIPIGFFPWSVFLGPVIIEMVRRLKKGDQWRTGYILALSWIVAVVGLWSAVALKLPHHILPAYPALALLTAPFVYSWITETARFKDVWIRNASLIFSFVGGGAMVAIPVMTWFFLPGDSILSLIGVPLLIGGIACWKFSRANRPLATMTAFTVASVFFLVGIFGFAVLRVDPHQNGPYLAKVLKQQEDLGECKLASYGHFRESFVYYTGGPVERLRSDEAIGQFLGQSGGQDEKRPYLITTDTHESKIRDQYPGQLEVVMRRPKFLKKGELVVLRPVSGISSTAAKPSVIR
jgi:4-amino-4-deoxy-L-arabinose transferase-like glycosyltransferase